MKIKNSVIGCLLVLSILLMSSHGQRIKDKGNDTYHSTLIGSQEWMTENLNESYFRNGDPIFEANSFEDWEKANIEGKPAWCYYNNDPENEKRYGKLYNWWAVSDPRGLAPEGWHIPSEKEWAELAEDLGGVNIAGGKMKSTNGWKDDGNGNNESDFSGLPGGYRTHEGPSIDGGPFYGEGSKNFWWSTSRYLVDNVWSHGLSFKNNKLKKESFVRTAGLSVRLIKD